MRKLIIGFTVALVLVAGFVLARQLEIDKQTDVPQERGVVSNQTAKELADVMRKIDTASELLLTGKYQLYDGLTNKMLEQEPFTMAKAGNELYLQVGYTEQIFKNGNTVFIDNNEHRIFFAGAREGQEQPVFKGMEALKTFIDDAGATVDEAVFAGVKTVTIKCDSSSSYESGVITYEPSTLKLKSSSMLMKVLMPGSEESRKVILKLVIDQFNDKNCKTAAKLLTDKVGLQNKQVVVADSLKRYQLNKD